MAVAAVLLCFGAFVLEGADVQCIWNGNTYVCSGTGSSIEVIGGGSGGPVTVTNFWGVCTNCVNMSPNDCETLKTFMLSDITVVASSLSSVLADLGDTLNDLDSARTDISAFRSFDRISTPPSTTRIYTDVTNWASQAQNTQAEIVRNFNEGITQNAYGRAEVVGVANGINDYALSLVPTLDSFSYAVGSSVQQVEQSKARLLSLSVAIHDRLNCEECQAEYEPGPDPGGSGSGVATNGNWCTFDQGEAIKTLLRDLKQWAERQHSQLVAISNFVEQSYNTMRDGLFTSYNHVPSEEDLGMHWQELYLSGYSPNFHEYAATNILARIELLLAGMSGVLTNSTDFASAGSFAEEGMEPTNELKTVVGDFTNEFVNVVQAREQDVRSVGDALVGLYNAFRGWSGTPFSRTTLIGSYSVELGEQRWDVPTFEPSEKGLWVGNMVRVVCRSVMSVIYILFSVAVLVRFSMAYFCWVWNYVRWGIELMQGLFA